MLSSRLSDNSVCALERLGSVWVWFENMWPNTKLRLRVKAAPATISLLA
jgi:hypothetical protein